MDDLRTNDVVDDVDDGGVVHVPESTYTLRHAAIWLVLLLGLVKFVPTPISHVLRTSFISRNVV